MVDLHLNSFVLKDKIEEGAGKEVAVVERGVQITTGTNIQYK